MLFVTQPNNSRNEPIFYMAKLFIPCYNRLADAPLELRGAAFENSLKPY